MTRACKNCQWFAPDKLDGDENRGGYCRFNPPVALVMRVKTYTEYQDVVNSVTPYVEPDHFCASYSANPRK